MSRLHDLSPLPANYQSAWGRHYPLRVGQWVYPGYWGRTWQAVETTYCYLWRVGEICPGEYELISQDGRERRLLTPELAETLCPLQDTLSDILRIEDHPEHWERFRANGVGVYFRRSWDGRSVVLSLKKPRVTYEGFLPELWAYQLQKDRRLMRRWLEQTLWCVAHPRKADALLWAANTSELRPFGEWPCLTTPEQLDAASKIAMPLYRKYRRHLRENPPTEEERREAQQRAMFAALQEVERLDRLRVTDANDEQQLRAMLCGLGIRPADS